MIVVRNIETGECAIVNQEGIDWTIWEATGQPVPDDIDTQAYVSSEAGLVAAPRLLTAEQVVALYTATEKARIFTSTEPAVQGLLNALRFSAAIEVGSTFHVQGTALIAGLGLLDTPERAARILAGEEPA